MTAFRLVHRRWSEIHGDYKAVVGGVRYVLHFDERFGSCLVPWGDPDVRVGEP